MDASCVLGPRPTIHAYDTVLEMIERRRSDRSMGGIMNNQRRIYIYFRVSSQISSPCGDRTNLGKKK